MRAVANTAGKASCESSGNALARSLEVTMNVAVAVELMVGSFMCFDQFENVRHETAGADAAHEPAIAPAVHDRKILDPMLANDGCGYRSVIFNAQRDWYSPLGSSRLSG
jgi:hypothetical protein